MICPALSDARLALEGLLFRTLDNFCSGEDANCRMGRDLVIVQPGEAIRPDMAAIQVAHTVSPGNRQEGENDPRGGIAPRPGVYTVLLSCPDSAKVFARAWKLADYIERNLSGLEISAAGGKVYLGNVNTTNIGKTADKRLGLSLAINWWIWADGYED